MGPSPIVELFAQPRWRSVFMNRECGRRALLLEFLFALFTGLLLADGAADSGLARKGHGSSRFEVILGKRSAAPARNVRIISGVVRKGPIRSVSRAAQIFGPRPS